VIGQMAAEQLGVPLTSVTVELGDSNLPPAPVAGGSNTTASVCSVVLKACETIRAKLFRAATTANNGPLTGRDPWQLVLKDGRLVAPDGASETLDDTLQRLGTGAIEEYAELVPRGINPAEGIKKLYAGQGALTGGSHGEKMMYAMG